MAAASALNIQVIDPDPQFRSLVLGVLEPFASRIIQSTCLREAELELPVAHPDLIIMDCSQPDGDGLQWLTMQRASGLKTPVFFLNSGCQSTDYFCQLVNAQGVKAVLHKPVRQAILNHLLEEHSKKSQAAALKGGGSAHLDDIEREIKEISLEYIRELPERFQVLIRQVEELKLGGGEPATAKNEAHKIKGTAGSYGVHDVGEQAVIIDDCLKRLIGKPEAATAELWAKLEAALKEALRLAEQAVAAAGAPSQDPAAYDSGMAMSGLGLSSSGGQTIVIVDDDEDFTSRISLVLGYEDLLVYSFNDARQIIQVIEHLQPDLLILDLKMPEMDGVEVCKRIRVDSRWQHLPIVFLTAQTDWETRMAVFDSGADDYIAKPVVNQELIARIRLRAEKSRLQDVVAKPSSLNKLLWQVLLVLLLPQESTHSA